jgi:hypothetical protein
VSARTEKVTVGAESFRRDFAYDNKGFLSWATEAVFVSVALPMVYARDDGGNVASLHVVE